MRRIYLLAGAMVAAGMVSTLACSCTPADPCLETPEPVINLENFPDTPLDYTTTSQAVSVQFSTAVSGVEAGISVSPSTAQISNFVAVSGQQYTFNVTNLEPGTTYQVSFATTITALDPCTSITFKNPVGNPGSWRFPIQVGLCDDYELGLDPTFSATYDSVDLSGTTAVFGAQRGTLGPIDYNPATTTDAMIDIGPNTTCSSQTEYGIALGYELRNGGCDWTPVLTGTYPNRSGDAVVWVVREQYGPSKNLIIDGGVVPNSDTADAFLTGLVFFLGTDVVPGDLASPVDTLDQRVIQITGYDENDACKPVYLTTPETLNPLGNYFFEYYLNGFNEQSGYIDISQDNSSTGKHFTTTTPVSFTNTNSRETWIRTNSAGGGGVDAVTCMMLQGYKGSATTPFTGLDLMPSKLGASVTSATAGRGNGTWANEASISDFMFGIPGGLDTPLTTTFYNDFRFATATSPAANSVGVDYILARGIGMLEADLKTAVGGFPDGTAVRPDVQAYVDGVHPTVLNEIGAHHCYNNTFGFEGGVFPSGSCLTQTGNYTTRWYLRANNNYYVRCSPGMGLLATGDKANRPTPTVSGGSPLTYAIEFNYKNFSDSVQAATPALPTITTATVTTNRYLCQDSVIVNGTDCVTGTRSVASDTTVAIGTSTTTTTTTIQAQFSSPADVHWYKLTVAP
jgi:hypothetical protein